MSETSGEQDARIQRSLQRRQARQQADAAIKAATPAPNNPSVALQQPGIQPDPDNIPLPIPATATPIEPYDPSSGPPSPAMQDLLDFRASTSADAQSQHQPRHQQLTPSSAPAIPSSSADQATQVLVPRPGAPLPPNNPGGPTSPDATVPLAAVDVLSDPSIVAQEIHRLEDYLGAMPEVDQRGMVKINGQAMRDLLRILRTHNNLQEKRIKPTASQEDRVADCDRYVFAVFKPYMLNFFGYNDGQRVPPTIRTALNTLYDAYVYGNPGDVDGAFMDMVSLLQGDQSASPTSQYTPDRFKAHMQLNIFNTPDDHPHTLYQWTRSNGDIDYRMSDSSTHILLEPQAVEDMAVYLGLQPGTEDQERLHPIQRNGTEIVLGELKHLYWDVRTLQGKIQVLEYNVHNGTVDRGILEAARREYTERRNMLHAVHMHELPEAFGFGSMSDIPGGPDAKVLINEQSVTTSQNGQQWHEKQKQMSPREAMMRLSNAIIDNYVPYKDDNHARRARLEAAFLNMESVLIQTGRKSIEGKRRMKLVTAKWKQAGLVVDTRFVLRRRYEEAMRELLSTTYYMEEKSPYVYDFARLEPIDENQLKGPATADVLQVTNLPPQRGNRSPISSDEIKQIESRTGIEEENYAAADMRNVLQNIPPSLRSQIHVWSPVLSHDITHDLGNNSVSHNTANLPDLRSPQASRPLVANAKLEVLNDFLVQRDLQMLMTTDVLMRVDDQLLLSDILLFSTSQRVDLDGSQRVIGIVPRTFTNEKSIQILREHFPTIEWQWGDSDVSKTVVDMVLVPQREINQTTRVSLPTGDKRPMVAEGGFGRLTGEYAAALAASTWNANLQTPASTTQEAMERAQRVESTVSREWKNVQRQRAREREREARKLRQQHGQKVITWDTHAVQQGDMARYTIAQVVVPPNQRDERVLVVNRTGDDCNVFLQNRSGELRLLVTPAAVDAVAKDQKLSAEAKERLLHEMETYFNVDGLLDRIEDDFHRERDNLERQLNTLQASQVNGLAVAKRGVQAHSLERRRAKIERILQAIKQAPASSSFSEAIPDAKMRKAIWKQMPPQLRLLAASIDYTSKEHVGTLPEQTVQELTVGDRVLMVPKSVPPTVVARLAQKYTDPQALEEALQRYMTDLPHTSKDRVVVLKQVT